VIGGTIKGASHVQRGIVNQDCISWREDHGRVILAVADGHGSAKSFRSDIGSRLAVRVSLTVAEELLRAAPAQDAPPTAQEVRAAGSAAHGRTMPDDQVGPQRDSRGPLPFVKDQLEMDIPRHIVRDWKRLVDADLADRPFSERELAELADRDGPESRRLVVTDGRLAYGSTLITVVAMENFAVIWQVGDGDVLTVSSTGEVGHPVPRDAHLLGNETTSLCSRDAARMFRHAVLGTPPPLIMLSTDGLSNSFQDDAGFFKFGSDIRNIIVEDGIDAVDSSIEGWLREITSKGSGDDISLGIVCRPLTLASRRKSGPEAVNPAGEQAAAHATVMDQGRSQPQQFVAVGDPSAPANLAGLDKTLVDPDAATGTAVEVTKHRQSRIMHWRETLVRNRQARRPSADD
jgi:hypothetical protein